MKNVVARIYNCARSIEVKLQLIETMVARENIAGGAREDRSVGQSADTYSWNTVLALPPQHRQTLLIVKPRMVLQNKYKARASRKYNADRGRGGTSRGSSSGGGRGRGGSSYHQNRDGEESEEASEQEGEVEDDQEEEQDSNFPSLSSASKSNQSTKKEGDAVKSSGGGNKYSKRKLESNSWRYHVEEKDPNLSGEYIASHRRSDWAGWRETQVAAA